MLVRSDHDLALADLLLPQCRIYHHLLSLFEQRHGHAQGMMQQGQRHGLPLIQAMHGDFTAFDRGIRDPIVLQSSEDGDRAGGEQIPVVREDVCGGGQ